MATTEAAAGLVTKLPARLVRFFARYPPQYYSARALGIPSSAEELEVPTDRPSPYTPSRDAKAPKPDPKAHSPSLALLQTDPEYPNPFLPFKNPETGRWRGSAISLRTQNDLVKIANKNGVEELLPPGRKATVFKEVRSLEKGLRIKGTGVGQKVKGHKWERMLDVKLDVRKKAMMEMPDMIRTWKQRGHGRGWKKYPK
ncbi:hypothetical protein AJ80_00257 [Polytolypa hystricis UAMH7299]|uniref:Large ribosomal subunit protein mL59 domain-containing protein n=1 Tax=Polytolypa hystricis (strain UAMH7299) TaxID=1447883 RepID=A0A2B7Z4N1_POLH7|nr:hypothetical protein AJ80_00257 [Polytolypa hystricis UAMH7299]